eukprot:TRINITY_DN14714_c4_g1_i1.p1 TRINITY_DN14714_c4_g1~~TRINITY_DN14714_c4_g1_i1.p1  ORF type:complete len:539 (+),score=77.34 TRINITY_DN14714_c4_g1_i1:102-1619(+)
MGNHCVCVQNEMMEEDTSPTSVAMKSKKRRELKIKEKNNPKCVSSIIADLNSGVSSIPCIGGSSWEYRPGCQKNSGALGGNDVRKIAMRLSTTHSLKRLELISRGFGDEGATAVSRALRAPSCSTMQYLSISHNNITDTGFTDICESLRDSNNTLKTLKVDGNILGSASLAALGDTLCKNTGLVTVELCIGGGSLPVESSSVMSLGNGLASNATLRNLVITGEHGQARRGDCLFVGVKPHDIRELFSKLTENNTLTSLGLTFLLGGFEDGMRECMAQCSAYIMQTKSLTSLDLTGNLIGDAGGVAVATSLASNTPLVSLKLARNRLTNETFEALAKSLPTSTLKKLDLSHSFKHNSPFCMGPKAVSLKPGAMCLLAGLTDNTSLTSLNISDVAFEKDVSEAALEMLKTNKTLTELRHGDTTAEYATKLGGMISANQDLLATEAAARITATCRAQTASLDTDKIPELAWRAEASDDNDNENRNDEIPKDEPQDFVEVAFDDDDCYQ